MTDITTVVDTYIATWNETDPERRRALVAETFTEDAGYLDPLMSGEGHGGIAAMIAGAQAAVPRPPLRARRRARLPPRPRALRLAAGRRRRRAGGGRASTSARSRRTAACAP